MSVLTSVQRQYVLHWGEMGTRWGINRTVAQIHALLYLSPKPLGAEEIASTLDVSRSNVSTSIRELETWGLVRPVHVLGERREHYEAMKSVPDMFRIIVEQRKRREVDPTVELLRRCLDEIEEENRPDTYTRERLQQMMDFFQSVTTAYEEVRQVSPDKVLRLMRIPGLIRKLVKPLSKRE